MLVISPSIRNLLTSHKRTLLAVVFIFLYSFSITLAVPPATKYQPGATLDPACAPTDTNCSVQILPDQTSNANKYLTTDGSSTAWSSSTLVLGGNFTTSGAYATTLTATGTTTLTLPTSGTLYGTASSSITSSQLLTSLSDETGTGLLVFNTAPSFTTSIATPSIISASGALGITPASGSNLNITLATTGDFTVNTNQLYVDTSTGNVGVGTTTFGTAKLVVNGNLGLSGTSGTVYGLYLPETGDHTGSLVMQAGFGSSAAGGAMTLYGASNVTKPGWVTIGISQAAGSGATEGRFTVNDSAMAGGTDIFTVLRTGNVGIGTSSPEAKLDVAGAITASGLISYNGTAATNTPFLWATGTTTGSIYSTFVNTGGRLTMGVESSIGGSLGSGTSAYASVIGSTTGFATSLQFITNGVLRTTIDSSGNIIITDLAGSGNRCVYADTNGQLGVKNDDCGLASGGDDMGDHTATQNITLGSNWLSGDGGNEGIRVDASGNVGIGTASPGYTLDVAGVINIPNGYQYQWGDGTTQMYGSSSGTSDYIALQTNTAERMRIDASGNVGIGTASPTEKLEVVGTILLPTSNQIRFQNGNNNKYSSIYNQGGSLSTLTFSVNDGATTAMYISNAGDIGMGTTSPAGQLHINSATNDIITRFTNTFTGTTATDGTMIEVGSSGHTYLWNYESANMYFGVNNASAMTILSGGNVGIGTTAPRGLFHIYGAEQVALTTYSGQGNTGGGDAVINAYRLGAVDAYLRMVDIVALGDDTNSRASAIRFLTTNTSNATGERMRIDGSGNVGIGITSPVARLHVKSPDVNVTTIGGLVANSTFLEGSSVGAASWGIAVAYDNNGGYPLIQGVDRGDTTARNILINPYGGFVGIGTTAPGVKLHVVGTGEMFKIENTDGVTANAYAQMRIQAGTATNYIWTNNQNSSGFYGGSNALNIYGGVGSPIAFFTNAVGTARMTIDTAGNVGIGTTAPTQLLQVGGNAGAMAIGDGLTGNGTSRLKFTSSNTVTNWQISNNDSISGAFEIMPSTVAGGTTFTTPAFIITSSGNVGIGTASPITKLHIERTTGSTNSSDMGLTVRAWHPSVFLDDFDNTNTWRVWNHNGIFRLSYVASDFTSSGALDAATFSDKFAITTDGNVGIGNTNPTYKLDITAATSGSKAFRATCTSGCGSSALYGYVDSGGSGISNSDPYTSGGLFYMSGTNVYIYSGATAAVQISGGYLGVNALAAGTANSLCYNTTAFSSFYTLSTCSSDSRLKQNVTPLDGPTALAGINALNTVSFNWDPTFANDDTLQFGLIAQEVAQVFPNLVSKTSPTPLTPDGTYSINFNGLYAPIIKSIQFLDIKVQALPEFDDDGSMAAVVAEFLRGIAEGIANIGQVRTRELCVEDDEGEICLTKSDIEEIMNSGGSNNNGGTPAPEPDPEPDLPAPDEGGLVGPVPDPSPEPPAEEPSPEPEPTPEPPAPEPEPVPTE